MCAILNNDGDLVAGHMAEDEEAWYNFEAARTTGDRHATCTAWWVFIAARTRACLQEDMEYAEKEAGWSASA